MSRDAGVQWQKAGEVFDEMQSQGCTPDVVTYTALISAYEKGGQWRRALAAFEQMRAQRCKPDAIVYNAITDALWETGVIWAQRRVSLCRLHGCLHARWHKSLPTLASLSALGSSTCFAAASSSLLRCGLQ